MLEDLTRDMFAGSLNTTFAVHYGGPEPIDMDLVEVSELRAAGPQRIYTLLFRGPLDVQLPQSIFRMEHPRLGEFELFIVPVARENDGMRYEAVFNQLVEK